MQILWGHLQDIIVLSLRERLNVNLAPSKMICWSSVISSDNENIEKIKKFELVGELSEVS